MDWQQRRVEVYRRDGPLLRLVATLAEQDHLESPLLPGLRFPVSALFFAENS